MKPAQVMAMRGAFSAPATDPYFASVSSLLHFNGVGASTTFTDVTGKTWTAAGNAQIDTAQSKFGGSSGLFDGAGDYISTPHHTSLNLAAGDFTLEGWIRLSAITGGNQMILNKDGVFGSSHPSYALFVTSSGKIAVGVSTGDGISYAQSVPGTTTLSLNTWYHVAATRSGTTLRVFVDGVKDAEATQTGTPVDGGKALYSGNYASNGAAEDMFNGWLDDIRITKGIARYAANFTPPASAFPNS